MPATTWIALLRGVNVGGNRMLPMAALTAMFEELGYAGAKTLLQSGNVVFRAPERNAAKLAARLERETASRLGVATTYLLRTAGEWGSIVANNPFPAEAVADPSRLLMLALSGAPAPGAVAALERANPGKERLAVVGRELYVLYDRGMGTSKLTANLIDRHFGGVCTGRNWNTVLKLARLAGVETGPS
jgi:uncharacterized protein (DUF1697 family)